MTGDPVKFDALRRYIRFGQARSSANTAPQRADTIKPGTELTGPGSMCRNLPRLFADRQVVA